MLYLVYALMFICSLAMVLYSAALGVKLSVRLKNPMTKAVLAILIPAAAALPGLVLSMLARDVCDPYFMLACSETGGVSLTWVYRVLLGWTAAAFLGGLVVLTMGFQNRGWMPASSDWHAEGLFFRAVVAAVLTAVLFFAADTLVTRELKNELAWYQKLHEWTEPLPPEGGAEGRQEYIAAYTAMQRIFGTPEDKTENLPEWWDDAFDTGSEFNAGAPEVRRFLWENKDIYALIASAASAPKPDMTPADLNAYRMMGRMLHLSARANAKRDWFISSMRDIRNILKMERHPRDSVGFIGYLHSLILRGYALDSLEEAMAEAGFYGTDTVQYPEFDDIFGVPVFRGHMRRQHAAITAEFLSELTAPGGEEEGQAERFKSILYRVAMAQHSLGCIKTAYEEEEAALSEGPASIAEVEDRPGDCKAYLSGYSDQYVKVAKTIARSRGAELALATVKYYRRHQRYPVDIFKLSPDFIDKIPADPYDDSGKMAMTEDDGALLFYSPAYELTKGQRIGFRLKKQ